MSDPKSGLQITVMDAPGSTGLLAKAVQGVREQVKASDHLDGETSFLPIDGHKWLVSEPGHPGFELGSEVRLSEGSLVFGDRGILASPEYGAIPVQLVRDDDIPLYVEEKMNHMVSFEQRWIQAMQPEDAEAQAAELGA